MDDYVNLLSPLRIGPIELPNRIVSTAHQTTLVENGLPTADFVAYHAARADGGVGMICMEATAVDRGGLLTGHTIAGYDPDVIPWFRAVAEAAHEAGSRLFAQIFHGGREQIEVPPRGVAVAPSAVPSQRFKTEPRALTDGEIRAIIDAHELVARHARSAGLDGLELCASHGYLPTQFLSERTNRRSDDWGGDRTRRTRYVRETLAALRRGAGADLAVGIRVSADEGVPEGRHTEETAVLLSELASEGLIDYASVVIGDSASYVGAAWIVPPAPIPRSPLADHGAILRAGLTVPLIVSTRVHEPSEAEALIANGCADAVGMNRALIADPELPRKLAENRDHERILCTACNQGCIGRYHLGLPIRCLQNPRTGREAVVRRPIRAETGERVVVIGAGPAGLAAAESAAQRGAHVVLVEQAAAIGGQFALAGLTPGHRETARRFAADWKRRLDVCGVDLRLSTAVTSQSALLDDADMLIVATGAQPYRPALTPPSGVALVDAWDAMKAPKAVRGPVLIADWGGGWTGLDAAETLAEAGLQVTLAVAAPIVGETVHQYQRVFYLQRFERAGIEILHYRELVESPSGATLRSVWTHEETGLPLGTATIVLALGREPDERLALELAERGRETVRVGDCRGPRSIEEAVLEGAAAGSARTSVRA